MRYINSALDAGVDALIVSDYGLMAYLKNQDHPLPLHVSTGGTVFNWRTVQFYKDLGAERVALPRHLSIREIEDIVSAMPPMETTIFILNSRCINVDGFCTFQHGLARKEILPMFRNACMLPYHVVAFPANRQSAESSTNGDPALFIQRQRIWETVHVDDYPCGACAMYEFSKMGITGLKIVGRGNPTERKIKDISFLASLIEYLKVQKPSKTIFRQKAKALYTDTYKRPCRMHMCYYPSVMVETGETNEPWQDD
jgi:putative protease